MKYWNSFEIAWVFIFLSLGIIITIITNDSILNFIILITGILCVVFAAKGRIFTYVFGIINSILYSYTAYSNGLFGEVGLNILFYIPMNFIGFFIWKKHLSNRIVIMKKMNIIKTIIILLISSFSIFMLGFFLSSLRGQNTPYLDASTNIIGITATFLMIWRYREQWLLYIILNLLTITMWLLRFANGSSDGSIMILMWTAFLINSVYGFYNWSKNAENLK